MKPASSGGGHDHVPDKRALKDELVRRLAADLASLEQAHQAAVEGATHDDAKPENDKDTRALEQSYLARGQALRVEELRRSVGETQGMPVRTWDDGPVALGALIVAEEDGRRLLLLLAPHGGGVTLGDGAVQVVTPRAALGRAVLGKHRGDSCEVAVAGRTREIVIVDVV